MKDYMILINEESKPVLVEVPQKPRNDIDDPLAYADSWMKYSDEYSKAISDNSKHIQFKDEQQVRNLLSPEEFRLHRIGQTFPLPTGYNVSLEYQVREDESAIWSEVSKSIYNTLKGFQKQTVAILSKLEEPYVVAKLEIPAEAVSKLESVVAPSEEVKQGEWISVDDRLPEVQTAVLIFCGGFSNPWLGYYRPSSKEWYMYYASGSAVCDDRIVTHWMKMPTPPEF